MNMSLLSSAKNCLDFSCGTILFPRLTNSVTPPYSSSISSTFILTQLKTKEQLTRQNQDFFRFFLLPLQQVAPFQFSYFLDLSMKIVQNEITSGKEQTYHHNEKTKEEERHGLSASPNIVAFKQGIHNPSICTHNQMLYRLQSRFPGM
jgi:hypothetical protein